MYEIWFVYIIECRDKELYVGAAKDVNKRVALHNKGIACRYTKFRGPVKLLYKEKLFNQSDALKREKEIKKFSRKKKLELVRKDSSA